MAIRAHGEAARQRAPGLDDELVSDALADVPQQNPVPRCEIAHTLVQQRGLAAGSGRVMIEREDNARSIVHTRAAHGLEVIESHGRGTIRAERAIHAADHDIACTRIAPRFRGENLLADRFAGHCCQLGYQSVARRTIVRTGTPVGPFAM